MDRRRRPFSFEPEGGSSRRPFEGRTRGRLESIPITGRTALLGLLIALGTVQGWAVPGDTPSQKSDARQQKQSSSPPAPQARDASQQKDTPQPKANPQPQPPSPQQQQNKQQMRGLDEQIQEVKSDVLSIAADLSRLEEKLIYPSGTQVAIFVALTKGDTMRLDAVRLQVDGQHVADYIYSFKELEALRKGGVQRLYVGNVATGDHKLEVVVEGKRDNGADVSRTDHFSIHKDVKPKMVELTVSGNAPITLGEW
jgi:hypothetical protein